MKRTCVVRFHGRRLHLAVGKLGHPAGFGNRRPLVRLQPARSVTARAGRAKRGRGAAVPASLMSSRSWVRIPPAPSSADAEHGRAQRAVTPWPRAVVVRLHPSASDRPRSLRANTGTRPGGASRLHRAGRGFDSRRLHPRLRSVNGKHTPFVRPGCGFESCRRLLRRDDAPRGPESLGYLSTTEHGRLESLRPRCGSPTEPHTTTAKPRPTRP